MVRLPEPESADETHSTEAGEPEAFVERECLAISSAIAEAISSCCVAAVRGDIEAQMTLGRLYAEGQISCPEHDQVVVPLLPHGDVDPRSRFSDDYASLRCNELAAYWYGKAAQQGSDPAASALAGLQSLVRLEQATNEPPSPEVQATVDSNPEPAESSERRPYEPLSPEGKERVLRYVKQTQDAGGIQPNLAPSLLGLDWFDFETRKFPESYDLTSFHNPGEFVILAFSALDAYAVSILAADFSFPSLGALDLTCSLKRRNPASAMHLEFLTKPERGRMDATLSAVDLADCFTEALHARGLKVSCLRLQPQGCLLEIAYPGLMIADRSPYLRNRPVDLWPQATLHLQPTEALRLQARALVSFLQMPPVGGQPN